LALDSNFLGDLVGITAITLMYFDSDHKK